MEIGPPWDRCKPSLKKKRAPLAEAGKESPGKHGLDSNFHSAEREPNRGQTVRYHRYRELNAIKSKFA